MRILLDECLPRQLKRHIHGHEVTTVPEAGLAGYKNGRLLREASTRYDVLVTVDRSMEFQQSFPAGTLAVVVLRARSNDITDLLPCAPELLQLLAHVSRGTVTTVRAADGDS